VTAFIACMSACPNLDALKIVSLRVDRPPTNMPGAFDYLHMAFRTHSFPSVRMLILPDILSKILPSFPQVRSLFCGEDRPTAGFRLMQDARRCCPHLEEVRYGGSSRVMIGCAPVPFFSRPFVHSYVNRSSRDLRRHAKYPAPHSSKYPLSSTSQCLYFQIDH
jgi:hypothetical protein